MSPVANPYFDAFQALANESCELRLKLRKPLIWAYAWAVPDAPAITAIADAVIASDPNSRGLIEIGAGTGYWAWLLAQAGLNVKAFDRATPATPQWYPIASGGSEALSKASEQTLLLSWPPLSEPLARDCLASFRGQDIVYVGEWEGRTAEPAFHAKLSQNWALMRTLEIPRWPGFEDQVFFFRRR